MPWVVLISYDLLVKYTHFNFGLTELSYEDIPDTYFFLQTFTVNIKAVSFVKITINI